MMGHREKARNGGEADCIGSPGQRWRDYMGKRHGKWRFWKKQINQRVRRNAKRQLNKVMKSYDEWQNERPASAPQDASAMGQPSKKWKATKEQIVQFWQNVQPNTPLAMLPIPYDHKGSTYQQDGIRITGSQEFITSTLARLKEFMSYENPSSKLMLVYRETEKQSVNPGDRTTYVFYIQAKQRGQKAGGASPVA